VSGDIATARPLPTDRAEARIVRALRRRAGQLRARVEPAAFEPVRLPSGRPSAAVVALDGHGGYLGTLVTSDGSALSVVGFQPGGRQQPPWVLVAVRGDGAGALVP
jgi:hypothetical protein